MAKRAVKKAPVRWGGISTVISARKGLPGMMKSKDIEIRAISSRTLPTAKKWAKKLGIPVAYGSYEDMLDDPDIEVVYNPLPNHLHVPLTLAAAAAGKHVLCEKPIALTAKEAAKLRAAPGGVMIAEAFMVRQHPQWLKAREIAQSGKLGTLRAIQCFFSYHNTDPKNVRNIADIGGGAVYDLGCYPIVTARFIFGAEPVRVMAVIDRGPISKPTGRPAPCSFRRRRQLLHRLADRALPTGQHLRHQGATRGRDSVQRAAGRGDAAVARRRQEAWRRLGQGPRSKADQYQLQGVLLRVVQRKERYSVEDDAEPVSSMVRSAKSGKWGRKFRQARSAALPHPRSQRGSRGDALGDETMPRRGREPERDAGEAGVEDEATRR
jgi:predicted dehydrogenase